jgi:hypothetical protein
MVLVTKALLLLPLPTRWPWVAAATVPATSHRHHLIPPAHMALAPRAGTMVVMTAVCNVSFFPRLLLP